MEKSSRFVCALVAVFFNAFSVLSWWQGLGSDTGWFQEFAPAIYPAFVFTFTLGLVMLYWDRIMQIFPAQRFRFLETDIDHIISKGGDLLAAFDEEKGEILDAKRMKLRMDLAKLGVKLPKDHKKWKLKELSAFAHVGNLSSARKLHKY